MQSHPIRSRVGQFTWLFLQAVSVVASILLAFAIDAWWDQRKSSAQKNAMLVSVKNEWRWALEYIESQCQFRRASLDNVKVLLRAAAAGRYDGNGATLERRLADLLWYSDVRLPSAAATSILSSGRTADIQNADLRIFLAEYTRIAAFYAAYGVRDQALVLDVIAPFLGRNASLLQLNNESFRYGRPGSDGFGADPTQITPAVQSFDNNLLLGNRDFQSVLIQKLWIDVDVQSSLCTAAAADIGKALQLIDQELENTT